LVHDIRSEDPNVKKIEFSDSNGVRFSHSVPIKDLLACDFKLTLNSKEFTVTVPHKNLPADFIGKTDIKDLIKKVYFMKIKEKLKNDPRKNISVSEFLEWCTEYGISESEARNLLKSLHFIGTVLNFQDNRQLCDTIFLNPSFLTDHLTNTLNLRIIKKSDVDLHSQLDILTPEYNELTAQKKKLERAAGRRADVLLFAGLCYLAAQFSILFRFVYFDFSWDVVEPVSYFVGLATIIGGLTFYVLTDIDFTYYGLRDHLKNRRLKKLYLGKNFDWKRWSELDEKITLLKKTLDIRN
jgi:hypothetical protein